MTISASGKLFVERRTGAVLVGGDDQLVALLLQELSQAEFAGNAAQQLPRLKVDLLGRRQRLAVGITLQLRQTVAGVRLGITVDGVVVKHADNFRHLLQLL